MRKGIILFGLLLIATILLFNGFAIADIINVPDDQPTIQAGINFANDADTVLVQPGTYIENINYNGKNIIVGSLFLTTEDSSYILQTTIDGNYNGHVVEFSNSEDSTAILMGFTITHGYGHSGGGGIYCYDADPILSNLIIKYNSTEGYTVGGGIACGHNSNPVITNITLKNNSSYYGGGIACDRSSPIIINVTINNNTSYDWGGGIYCYKSNPNLKNVIIKNNNASSSGGGIWCDWSAPIIKDVMIQGNYSGNWGGGICFSFYDEPTLINVIIAFNVAYYKAGGIYFSRATAVLENVTIGNNSVSYSGGNGGGIYCNDEFCSINLRNSIMWNDYPQEIFTEEEGVVLAQYSDIQGGWQGEGNIDADPLFIGGGYPYNYHLQPFSPCINAGDPCVIYNDFDSTRNDMGFSGGSDLIVNFTTYDFGPVGVNSGKGINEKTVDWIIGNYRDTVLTINDAFFNIPDFQLVNENFPISISQYCKDTLTVRFTPFSMESISDTLSVISSDWIDGDSAKIYFHGEGISDSTIAEVLFGILLSSYSPYLVVNDVVVPEGETLIIEPGVELRFTGHYKFEVNGLLLAQGTEDAPILFTRNYPTEECRWGGLWFYNADSASILSYTKIEYVKSNHAGGILCSYSSPTIKNVTLSNNIATYAGGGIGCLHCSPTLENMLITNNEAYYWGGGMWFYDSGAITINSTVYGNTGSHGGGIHCDLGSSPTLKNSIVWNNYPDQIYHSYHANVNYSDIQDGCNGVGNIDADPLFADPQNGDFHLTWANFPIQDSTMSPCIDAGDPNSPLDPDSTRADMGAFYFDQNQQGVEEMPILPTRCLLYQNYPNPFSTSTTISFNIATDLHRFSQIKIYNIKGQLIKTLILMTNDNPRFTRGQMNTIEWNGKDESGKPLSSGIYIYCLKVGDKIIDIKRCLILK